MEDVCGGRGARGWGTVAFGTAITTILPGAGVLILTAVAEDGLVKFKGCPVAHNPGVGTLATTSTDEEDACGTTLTNL